MDPISLGVTGLGLLSQGKGNKKAQSGADAATKEQANLLKRISMLFDTQYGIVQQAQKAGQFDPAKQQALADEAINRNEGNARNTLASTNRILGYRPGDSEPQLQDRKLSEGFNLKRRMQNFDINNGAFANLLNSYSSINPSGVASAAQMQGGIAKNYQSQMTNPADTLNAFLKYYQASKNGGVIWN